ncbi:MAG: hydantoinase/oxoprolinase family protein [Anaerolineales bacterium]|jgi:N-methylhydantoinase A|nr:hydantoinase/oxoprolinase family protein [Anaerolineales bacterium]|tara:strand:+ start:17287 stop:19398 length:2112 start_codon:yes stop_codon:yes gene_type:complete
MSYRIGIDVGGTFTDFLLLAPDGTGSVFKTATTPLDPAVGLLNGLQDMADTHSSSLPEFVQQVGLIVHGTTVATNAVLTGTGARTGLLTTDGFRDALQMRRGIREAQYDNRVSAPTPLVPRYLRRTATERVDYRGHVCEALHESEVQSAAEEFSDGSVEAVAICFMHAYANADHEKRAASLLRDALPEVYVTASSELLPQIRFYDRTSTTVLNAYVGPLVKRYLESLTARLEEEGFAGLLLIMQSNGGVVSAQVTMRAAAGTLLSGPAAGPIAGLSFAKEYSSGDCITVDMGGTSFDAALIVNRLPHIVTDGRINGHLLALPMLDIHTIGAGGGSIGWIDAGGFLRMGPQSAGAVPGPACYECGGELPTSTDADLVLGYLAPDYFLGGKLQLYPDKARVAIREHVAEPLGMDVEEAAAGMFAVINNNMADGIREISVQRGYDPRDFPLVVAGGAGPIHAAVIAQELEIPLLIIPRASSIFCAAGMLFSDLKHDYVRAYPTSFEGLDPNRLRDITGEMESEARATLIAEHISAEKLRLHFSLDLRSQGQYHEVSVPIAWPELAALNLSAIGERFHTQHDQLYGYAVPEAPLELVSVRLTGIGETEKPHLPEIDRRPPASEHALRGARPVFLPERNKFTEVHVYAGDELQYGNQVEGPAIIEQETTTIFVTDAYQVSCDALGSFAMSLKDLAQPAVENLLLWEEA